MKKFLAFLMSCLITSVALAQGEVVDVVQKQEDKTKIQKPKEECGYQRPLRVASGIIGNPPFAWEEYADVMHTKFKSFGLGLNVIEDLSQKLGFQYESTGFPTYEDAVQALKMGDIDILFTTYYRNLGMGTKTIYPGYFVNVFQAYVKKDSDAHKSLSGIKTYKDLIGWKGIVREEEQIYPLFEQRMRELKLKKVLSAPTVFKMLINEEADYLIGSPYAIEAELRRQKLQDDIVPVGGVLDKATLLFTFSTNSNCAKMAKDFEKTLKENPMSDDKIQDIVFDIIDNWGNRFREEKGVLEKEQEALEQKETETDQK